MSNELYTIIYTSTGIGISEEDLKDILKASNNSNRYAGITGILLYGQDEFIQVLEGPKDAVMRTYTRICQDKRHSEISPLVETPIDKRVFGQWAMAYAALSENSMKSFGGNLGVKSAQELVRLMRDPRHFIGEFVSDAFKQMMDGGDDHEKGVIKISG